MSTTDNASITWAISDIEPMLADLRGTIGLLGHLKDSPHMVRDVEWVQVRDRLLDLHRELEGSWQRAWDERIAEKRAHEAALAAAKAEKAAPGSVADIQYVEGHWTFLRTLAKVIVENDTAAHATRKPRRATKRRAPGRIASKAKPRRKPKRRAEAA